MNIEDLRLYCIAKKAVTESFPFDEDTLVFKVMGKMFALVSISEANSVNLKCDPAYAIELREQYTSIQSGFHMNHKHWNTVLFNEDAPDQLIYNLIDHSYDAVLNGMTKKLKQEYDQLSN
ncbi:MAG: MmcQ/YjbR family DNA-binding protein [Bacteroidota bacterium]